MVDKKKIPVSVVNYWDYSDDRPHTIIEIGDEEIDIPGWLRPGDIVLSEGLEWRDRDDERY